MKKTILGLTIIAALMLSLAGCGKAPAAESRTPAGEPQVTAAARDPAEADGQAAQSGTDEPAADTGRKNGERFETVIILEGMEETVRYEHVRNDTIGFEMDYDYESFVRHSESGREVFLSIWDDPKAPENYLEVTASAEDADAVAASVSERLSQEYELLKESRELDRAGRCIRIEASELKGTGRMADQLQAVYIIPAPDGCRVAAAHFSIESAEGFGRRFAYMLNTFSAISGGEEKRISDEQALAAIKRYCYLNNPDLEGMEKAGEYPVYWDVSSSDEQEIVILFRSYTGAQIRYHIDPVSGEAYVTEFVPGITAEEERTDESLNIWEYIRTISE